MVCKVKNIAFCKDVSNIITAGAEKINSFRQINVGVIIFGYGRQIAFLKHNMDL